MKENGSATVETALATIAITTVMAIAFSGLSVALTTGKTCADAREAARSIAIGEPVTVNETHIVWEKEGTWIHLHATRNVPAGRLIGHSQVECEIHTRNEQAP